MNKVVVSVFNTEEAAVKGLDVLKTLHSNGDISVYSTAVLQKNEEGKVEVKQGEDAGPIGTAIGGLTGALLGMFAGPGGLAVGTAAGMYGGMFFDLNQSFFDVDLLEEASQALEKGKTAVIAEIEEEWTAPLDSKMGELGAEVLRKNKSDVEDAQLKREADELNAEWKELQEEWQEANDDMKDSIKKQMDKTKAKSAALKEKIEKRSKNLKEESKAKTERLEEQIKDANENRKSKLEKRKAELKKSQKASKKKLEKAGKKIKKFFKGE